jgi:hypothetical protein
MSLFYEILLNWCISNKGIKHARQRKMGTSHDESKLIRAWEISYAFPNIFASKVLYLENTHFVKIRMEIQHV